MNLCLEMNFEDSEKMILKSFEKDKEGYKIRKRCKF